MCSSDLVESIYEISKEIDFKLNFMCYARVDLLRANPKSLDMLVNAGVRGMFFGIESVNEITGRHIGKKFTGDRLKNYLTFLKTKYPQLHLTGSFIVGLPFETAQMAKNNIVHLVDNKLLDAVTVYPLNIPINNAINYISPFSNEWKNYGYTELTDDELDLINPNKPLTYLKKHYILWKNEFMNCFEAENYANNIKNTVHDKITMGGWNCFTGSFEHLTLDHYCNTLKVKLDWDYIKNSAFNYVNKYKINKLSI